MLMVNRGYIAETDLSFLEDIFTNLFRKDLVSDIREYMNHTDCNSVSGTIPKTSAGNAEGRITDDEKAENIPTIGGLELETTKTIDESNADICAEDVSIDSVHSATNISDEDKQTAAMGSQPPLRKNSWKYEEKSSNRKRISTSLFISYEQIKHGFGVLQSTSNSV
ncbi:uncharacterized protein LOC127856214 isoform X2 [Dreissena polymorpha]|nr:uncharacterized protein LOC127856214 isoform X2 [Dreissena polymorpha]